jgi:hypothetical protein
LEFGDLKILKENPQISIFNTLSINSLFIGKNVKHFDRFDVEVVYKTNIPDTNKTIV